jgi:hypothetical protein
MMIPCGYGAYDVQIQQNLALTNYCTNHRRCDDVRGVPKK